MGYPYDYKRIPSEAENNNPLEIFDHNLRESKKHILVRREDYLLISCISESCKLGRFKV